jgi:lysophospholipid acyltransferase (LPLAT)-like uncharacterized protein
MAESPLTASERTKASAIAMVGAPLVGALCRTLAWRVDGAERYDGLVSAGRHPILVCWHGRILPGLYHFRHRGIVALASRNFDGEWIARLLARYGYGLARGSSSRGGATALVQMRRALAGGHPVVFTVDGPRGPARVAQAGAAWLAGATGQPILPFHIEADRFWMTSSWDRAQIPKPFARTAVAIGDALDVHGTGEAEIERGRKEIERALEQLETRARRVLGT